MKVKIGDTWYSSTEQPICVQTTDKEHDIIVNMRRDGRGQFASAPDDYFESPEHMLNWMNDGYSPESSNMVASYGAEDIEGDH